MNNSNNVKIIAIVILLVSILCLSVAYSALSTSLNITGSAIIRSARWDVAFSNGKFKKLGSAGFVEPVMKATSITDFKVSLNKPGDGVIYYFNVNNFGSLDAKLSSLTITPLKCEGENETETEYICKNISYDVSYSDDSSINIDDELSHETTKKLKLTIKYNENANVVATNPITISNLDVIFIYDQK